MEHLNYAKNDNYYNQSPLTEKFCSEHGDTVNQLWIVPLRLIQE